MLLLLLLLVLLIIILLFFADLAVLIFISNTACHAVIEVPLTGEAQYTSPLGFPFINNNNNNNLQAFQLIVLARYLLNPSPVSYLALK